MRGRSLRRRASWRLSRAYLPYQVVVIRNGGLMTLPATSLVPGDCPPRRRQEGAGGREAN